MQSMLPKKYWLLCSAELLSSMFVPYLVWVDSGTLEQRPQDTFLQIKLVGSKFITHSKCLKQPVAQKWAVVKSESDFTKSCTTLV